MLEVEANAKKIMQKFNISESYAVKILTSSDELLTLEEIRMKYLDENIGKSLPNWITSEELYNLCCKVVNKYYNQGFNWYNSREEVVSELYIWVVTRIRRLDDVPSLYKALEFKVKNYMRDIFRRIDTMKYSLSESDYVSDNQYLESGFDELELASVIRSIKETRIKKTIIIIAYFSANIDCLYEDLIDIYTNATKAQKAKLESLYMSDRRLREYLMSIGVTKNVKIINNLKGITPYKVANIFGKVMSAKSVNELALNYITKCGIKVNL